LNLKKIEISGFKSFLNRLQMDFSEGITAVLGPNGCGKTNIVDAIRWVLGEQKTRLLRNTKMENVIFNGTKLRKPLGLAEVHLTLSNEEGRLPLDQTEVTISRKLYRSGISEYYINGELARLKSIRSLLVDTGLGNNSYSIIEREMVDSVISDKDQDKRFLLEEAAGVMRYRIQREEAIRKIKHTETDLTRLGDILAELDKEIRSLRYQMGKAKRYTRLKDRVDLMEAALVKRSLFDLLEKKGSVEQERAYHEGITLADENEISLLENRLQESRLEGTESERSLQDMHETRYSLSQSLKQHEEKIAILDERINGWKKRIEEDGEEIERSREKLAAYSGEISTLRETIAAEESRVSTLEGDVRSHGDKLGGISEDLDRNRELLRDGKQVAIDLVRRRERERSLRQHLGEGLQELMAKKDSLASQLASVSERDSDLRAVLARHEGQLAEKREAVSSFSAMLENASSRAGQVLELLAGCEDVYSRAKIDLNRYDEKKQYLERIKDEHSRRAGDVLMQKSRIKGVLADHVHVAKEHRSCFEACLSPVLHSLMAETKEDAIRCLEENRRVRSGRLQIMYPNGRNGRDPELASGKNVIGTAWDLLGGKSDLSEYLHGYLADIAVVTDVEAALEVLGEREEARVATLDGVFFEGQGRIIVAGTEDVEMTLLEYDAKIGELDESARIAEGRMRNVDRRKAKLKSLKERLARDSDEMRGRLSAAEAEKEMIMEARRQAEIELTKVREKQTSLSQSLKEEARSIAEIEGKLKSSAGEGGNNVSEEANDMELGELEGRVALLERDKDVASEAVSKVELELVAMRGELSTLRAKLKNMEKLDAELTELIAQRRGDAARCEEEILNSEREIETTRGEILRSHGEVDGVERKIETVKENYESIKNRCEEMEKRLKEMKEKRDQKRENLNRCKLDLATIDTRISGLLEKAREKFNQDLEPYLEDKKRFDPSEWEEMDHDELAELRTRLENFGPVNMLAIEEFQEKKERFDFLSKQKQDLEQAKVDLLQAIRRINREARTRLTETFEQVRRNFKSTFLTLFDGGEADLLFADSDDPLEANIRIVASPKGKRLHDISSLSGGERALVALSLLFAIYLVKPSPFCVFDEVDAPLDDANIARFVRMLRAFTEKTQFIVITHNKRTMEAADFLYGVTMAEPGVSSLISVHLGDDDKTKDKSSVRSRPSVIPVESPEEEVSIRT
jgi:chromosome segregation protein